ncbi:MAG: N-acetylmuramoyl-L-alanine amidase [Pseudoalteromonas tunicata]|nr:N-acetylmuramoyl-L-alanine amidase [Pseudoalteromonas tunicata]MDP4982408.1 N-acetylmuramoyl-L-alanine amidase [Pseudoalteromonas tunicata]MDP5211715.1 N-acetylmuramoyl-L-alanine amidase [Pseudoalteromonas tunicata]
MHIKISTAIFFLLSFVLLSCFSTVTSAANEITSVRVWPSPESTRVVFDLKKQPDFSYFMLKKPLRLVIDFKDTTQQQVLPSISDANSVIEKIRYSTPKKKGWVRIVLELNQTVKPVLFALAPTAPYSDRLVVDLYSAQSQPAESDKNSNTLIAKNRDIRGDRDIVIAVDAGHGGEDPGSIGPSGTYEKTVTLQIAKRLAKLIDSQEGMKAILPRTGDYYVKLNTRSDRARKNKADFLISIHADAFITPQPRGASVFVLSLKRANSEIGKWIEDSEKQSELLGGAADVLKDTQNEKYLAQTLLDMSMDHSMRTGFQVADEVVSELGKVTKLHKKRPQAASLAVLKSPDIPSILVETGYISNPEEERLLKTRDHQEKLATAVFSAVKTYFINNPPDDSLFAQRKAQQSKKEQIHKVRSGESLSVVASQYGVSISALKEANKLSTNNIVIGQTLTIPRS